MHYTCCSLYSLLKFVDSCGSGTKSNHMSAHKTVVIIDDDSDDPDLLNSLLREIDESILCVSFLYADEAVRLPGRELVLIPDVFFIDINIPRISGTEVLKRLRTVPEFFHSRVVMYSTSMPENVSRQLVREGANLTMQKPYNISDYLPILNYILTGTGDPCIQVVDGHIRIRATAKY